MRQQRLVEGSRRRVNGTNEEDLPRSMVQLETEDVLLEWDKFKAVLGDRDVAEDTLGLEDASAELGRARDEKERIGV